MKCTRLKLLCKYEVLHQYNVMTTYRIVPGNTNIIKDIRTFVIKRTKEEQYIL